LWSRPKIKRDTRTLPHEPEEDAGRLTGWVKRLSLKGALIRIMPLT
jgi:hypothetical protein